MKKITMKLLTMVIAFAFCAPVPVYGANSGVSNALIGRINELRTQEGLPALSEDPSLDSVAAVRAEETSVNFSHYRADGSCGADMIPGDVWKGENLSFAENYGSDDDAVQVMFDSLKASPTHLENMVFNKFSKIGVASFEQNGKVTVAYMFSS